MSQNRIVITADTVTVYNGELEVVSAPADAFLANVRTVLAQATTHPSILPPRVVWLANDQHAAVFERPPTLMNITYQLGTSDDPYGEVYSFAVPLPWLVYGVAFDPRTHAVASLRVFTRNYPLMSRDDPLYVACLPNMDANAEACLAGPFQRFYQDLVGPDAGIGERLAAALNTFWSGTFNNDYPTWNDEWRMADQIPGFVRSIGDLNTRALQYFEYLQQFSRADVATWNYVPSNVFIDHDTLGALIEHLQSVTADAAPGTTSTPQAFLRALIGSTLAAT